jgi:predicted secreted acid phosphatase
MSWDAINQNDFSDTKAKQANAAARVKAANLAKAYHRCFGTDDGKLVLADLTQRFIFQNNTPFGSENPNYESAYHNGESGIVKFLINQVQQAEVL